MSEGTKQGESTYEVQSELRKMFPAEAGWEIVTTEAGYKGIESAMATVVKRGSGAQRVHFHESAPTLTEALLALRERAVSTALQIGGALSEGGREAAEILKRHHARENELSVRIAELERELGHARDTAEASQRLANTLALENAQARRALVRVGLPSHLATQIGVQLDEGVTRALRAVHGKTAAAARRVAIERGTRPVDLDNDVQVAGVQVAHEIALGIDARTDFDVLFPVPDEHDEGMHE